MDSPVFVPSILRSGSIPRAQSQPGPSNPSSSGDSDDVDAAPNRIRPLTALCAKALTDIITRGFSGIGTRVTGLSGLPYTAVDARTFFFSREASKVLERLDRDGVIARYVLQQSAPPSTALYCACATLYCVSSYDITQSIGLGSVMKRNLDLSITKYAGACWANLRRLRLVGCGVDREFLEILGSGRAANTLELLDLSSTMTDDNCLEALEPFQALTQLELNTCPEITVVGLQHIVRFCPKLRILGISNNEIGVAAVLETLSGPSAPLPHLRELRMESDGWQRQLPSLLAFCDNRKYLDRLKVWGIIPKLEYPDKQCCEALITKGPWRKVHIRLDSFERLNELPKLRYLQLQIPSINQNTVNALAKMCPRLETLLLTSTRFDSGEGVDLSVLNRIEDLALPDAYLGTIVGLPRRMRSFTATIMAIDNHTCADTFMNAVLNCVHLRKLHLFTAQSEFKTASFTSESFRGIIQNLRLLEDLAIDRDMFGRERLAADYVTVIPISHPNLTSFKIISTFVRTFLPYIASAPSLLAFTATNHLESIASLETLSLYSLNLRALTLRFDRFELVQMEKEEIEGISTPRWKEEDSQAPRGAIRRQLARKRSNSQNDVQKVLAPSSNALAAISPRGALPFASPRRTTPRSVADLISDCFKRLNSIQFVSIYGGTERLTSSLRKLNMLHHLKLSYCILPTATLERLIQDMPSIRVLELERCSQLSSIAGVKSAKLAKFSVVACNGIKEAIAFSAENLPALEIVTISNLEHIRSIVLENLPELHWATLSRVHGLRSIVIRDVPKLTDLAVDGITTIALTVEAPTLHRVFLDCSRTFSSSLSSESTADGVDVAIQFKSPELRKLSWQADDTDTEGLLEVLKQTPKVQILDLPAYSVEDIEPLRDFLKENCPLIKVVGCGDGDVTVYELAPPTVRAP